MLLDLLSCVCCVASVERLILNNKFVRTWEVACGTERSNLCRGGSRFESQSEHQLSLIEVFHDFLWFLQANAGIVPRLDKTASFEIHSTSLVVLPVDAVCSI
jgi:hypothetical protein